MKTFEQYEGSSVNEVDRLNEILEEIEELMIEADQLVMSASEKAGDDLIYQAWKVYPYNNIVASLSGGRRYETTFISIIEQLEKTEDEEEF